MMNKPKNILLAGIGGQGINLITQLLQKQLLEQGTPCKGAIYKGGAQKRGAVYSTIRIFNNNEELNYHSSQIPSGELDLLIGFEANEVLRYAHFYHSDTTFRINEYRFPFYNERYKAHTLQDPIAQLHKNFKKIKSKNYNILSKSIFHDEKMLNILLTIDILNEKLIDLDTFQFLDTLQKKIQLPYEKSLALLEYADSENTK